MGEAPRRRITDKATASEIRAMRQVLVLVEFYNHRLPDDLAQTITILLDRQGLLEPAKPKAEPPITPENSNG